MEVAFVGTRGIPARYGGFETAVEEIAARFVEMGVQPVVYCRNDPSRPPLHRGARLVHLPALHRKSLETLSHTFLSVLHLLWRPVDAVLVFNGANAIFVPLLRLRGMRAAVHVDGLEWKRGKWSWPAKWWHRFGERAAVRFAAAVVADAPGIARYYADVHQAETVQLSYGAPILRDAGSDRIEEIGLERHRYHLVVARWEPENHVDLIVDGYASSGAAMPLVVVGAAAYGGSHADAIQQRGRHDPQIMFLGPVWDQHLLDQLYANALTYLHGHSVGGTNPSLLRALGAGAGVVAFDVDFNRDVVGAAGRYFATAADVAAAVREAEANPAAVIADGRLGQEHVEREYRWDDVAEGYLDLCRRLCS